MLYHRCKRVTLSLSLSPRVEFLNLLAATRTLFNFSRAGEDPPPSFFLPLSLSLLDTNALPFYLFSSSSLFTLFLFALIPFARTPHVIKKSPWKAPDCSVGRYHGLN